MDSPGPSATWGEDASHKKPSGLSSWDRPQRNQWTEQLKFTYKCHAKQDVAPREFVDASEPNEVNLARHINHSCDPNAVVELWNDTNSLPRALVISKRTIFPGEEITIHYGSDFMPSPCLCEKCIQGVTSSSAGGKASNTETSRAHDGLRVLPLGSSMIYR
ncbi:hypothetical protein B0H14DRAFT_3175042, partial [Mycena olivaceomarginata]